MVKSSRLLLRNDPKGVKEIVQVWIKSLFSREYVEIQR
jgi:hypothetical protein